MLGFLLGSCIASFLLYPPLFSVCLLWPVFYAFKGLIAMLECATVMSVVITMAVGMLLIDLAALQENMVCSNTYSNASTCPELFFAQSYHAARMKFKDAAQEMGAEWQQHIVLQEDGFDYTVDTAFLRGKRPNNLLIHMSGIHGVDGFTGSAVQVKLLREWNSNREDGPSVLFVHAVNPYGMAHFRIYNEKKRRSWAQLSFLRGMGESLGEQRK
ncbi:hypothetical protein TraAM80_00939 [Trypanosoma rangeli]|uniref:DUF2817 domain-containing protein n=1 Tax=Trypanosoma rangeli TaxID=5698 RepID=A0A3R7KWW8_TRYRA|nr:uncharacterized protein TraAM80_00939 [Trypanosoma rangeli]RNF11303.1 hypothetical protein TraAM80_00939 [Trypanosoma rangeli]|eukprot:RNF11303.1 hypothetical protein TraAM80_00939 [Trypanosoma rangeli]